MIYIIVGFLMLGVGSIGVLLPIIPTVPFLLLSAICFGRSSEKLNTWFKETSIYKKNLESYVDGKGMNSSTKTRIVLMVTLLIGFGFYMMESVPICRAILFVVWIFHIYYFVFKVETIKNKSKW
jgi:uncharacterized membrane protein YbaN (DUF454 family)